MKYNFAKPGTKDSDTGDGASDGKQLVWIAPNLDITVLTLYGLFDIACP